MADRGAPFARGQGRPGREPDERRQTDAPPLLRSQRRRERRGCGSAGPRREALTSVREPLPTHVQEVEALPPAAVEALDAAFRDLGLDPAGPARSVVDGHLRLLLAWTRAINLTSIRDPVDAVTRHVLDSLAAVSLLRDMGVDRFVDLGSGGGYPGLPLAAATPSRALLVDSVAKKVRFLDAAIGAVALGDRVVARAARAETLAAEPAERGRWPLVTARAVGSLPELVELSMPLLELGGSLVAWKRGDLVDELAGAARAARALGAEEPEVHPVRLPALEGHVLVTVRKRAATPAEFPRAPAVRARRPW